MIKKVLLLLLIFFTENIYSQQTEWKWVKSITGQGITCSINCISCDVAGNIIIVGEFFSSTINFGNITLTNTFGWGNSSCYIAKYDPSGNVLWAKTANGVHINFVRSKCVATDKFGNIYVTGFFHGDTLSFGNQIIPNKTNNLYNNMFVVKYNANGVALWAKCTKCNHYLRDSYGEGITADNSGNVYVAGRFRSEELIFDSITLLNSDTSNMPSHDIFILKCDPSGNAVWIKGASGVKDDEVSAIAMDGNDFYITGSFFSPTLSFQDVTLFNGNPPINSENFYLAKFNSNGNIKWAKSNPTSDYALSIGIAPSHEGHVYATGNFFSNTMIFGNDTLVNIGGFQNSFFAVYDTSGNFIKAKCPRNNYDATIHSIASGSNGDFYVTGTFRSTEIKFDNYILTNSYQGTEDFFIVKYDSVCNVIWAKLLGGTGTEYGYSLTARQEKLFIAGGTNSDTLMFGNIALTPNVPPDWASGYFIAKLDTVTYSNIENNENSLGISVFPNPAKEIIIVVLSSQFNEKIIEIFNVHGKLLLQQNTNQDRKEINIGNFAKGIYFVKVIDGDVITVKKIIKE